MSFREFTMLYNYERLFFNFDFTYAIFEGNGKHIELERPIHEFMRCVFPNESDLWEFIKTNADMDTNMLHNFIYYAKFRFVKSGVLDFVVFMYNSTYDQYIHI